VSCRGGCARGQASIFHRVAAYQVIKAVLAISMAEK
jgi:hypothetical protein